MCRSDKSLKRGDSMRKILSLTLILLLLATPLSALAEGQDEKLPYQEWIDKGWLIPYNPDENGHDRDGWYKVKIDKAKEIAYSDRLKNTDRLIVVEGDFSDPEGVGLLDVTKDYEDVEREPNPNDIRTWRAFTINIISVNGVPWQETAYRDLILQVLYDRWEGLKDPAYNRYVIDPKYNGYTSEYIYFWDGIDIWPGKDEINIRFELKEYKKKLPTKVIKDGSHTMIPLRGVLEELGATISYDSKTKEITIKDKGKTVVLKIGSDIAVVDGKKVQMPKPVYTLNGYTMIPVRFVAENLDHYVQYFPANNEITIWRGKTGTPPRI